MKLLRRFSIAILSALVFALSLAFFEYTSSMEQRDGVSTFTISALFVLYLLYSLPIYVIGGIVYSHYVDVYFEKIKFRNEVLKYITYILVYIAGGLFIVGLLLLITYLIDGEVSGLLISNIFILGVLASLIFFHISLLVNKVLKIKANGPFM